MTNYQHLTVETDARGLARVTLNRPEVKNAFNEQLIADITAAMNALSKDANARIVVLQGAGDAFSAGADLSWMKRASNFSAEENLGDARRLAAMLNSIYTCEKPVVALIHGPCMGGGTGLASACDIVIASDDAFFALSEVRLGIIPAVISPFVLHAIGARQARRFFLTGERFDAAKAKEIGLAHMVCLRAQMEGTLDGVVKNLLACGPAAQGEAKKLIRIVAGRPVDEAVMDDTARIIARVRSTPEGKEGVAAFLEKRKANWISG
ncbi:MAG: enoyl-CoA hydratase/isomerase family protein [Parvularculaceae bacterium]